MAIGQILLLKKSSKKGMALIMVLSTIVFVVLIIQETVFETQVEYRSAIAELNSLRAYYAAKAGMEVNILRVKSYIKVIKSNNNIMNQMRPYVDLIWKFPFQWPPPIPTELDSITAEEFSKINSSSFMQKASFITFIEPESSKIDINDLASPIPSLRKWTYDVLYRLIHILRLKNKNLEEAVNTQDIVDVLNNIQDWVDPNTQQNERSTSESNLYEQEGLPRNRSFVSLEELHQVTGMSNILYTALEPFITVYGEKGLNVNTASPELLQALHDVFTVELAQEINALTSNPSNPIVFTQKTFLDFLNEKGVGHLNQHLIPPDPPKKNQKDPPISYIIFDTPYNFRIESTGFAGDSQRTITATYFDTASFTNRFNKLMTAEKQREQINMIDQIVKKTVRSASSPTKEEDKNPPLNQKQEPTIIYWKEGF